MLFIILVFRFRMTENIAKNEQIAEFSSENFSSGKIKIFHQLFKHVHLIFGKLLVFCLQSYDLLHTVDKIWPCKQLITLTLLWSQYRTSVLFLLKLLNSSFEYYFENMSKSNILHLILILWVSLSVLLNTTHVCSASEWNANKG